MLMKDNSLAGGVMIRALDGLIVLLGGLIACRTCNTLVKSTEEGMHEDAIIWNIVYILSSAYINVVVCL